MGFRFKIVTMLSVLCFVLSGCVTEADVSAFMSGFSVPPPIASEEKVEDIFDEDGYIDVDIEALLDVRGNWNLVEQGRGVDPTQAHMLAREKVDIKRRKYDDGLSAHFQLDAKSGEDGTMRVLSLQRGSKQVLDVSVQYDVSEISVVKPSRMVSESDLPQKVLTLLGEKYVASQSDWGVSSEVSSFIIVPRRKPVRNPSSEVLSSTVQEAVQIQWFDREDYDRKPDTDNHLMNTHRDKVEKRQLPQYARVIKLRDGDHVGKSRLVVEVTKSTEFHVSIDSSRNVLLVDLIQVDWGMPIQGSFEHSSLLKKYKVYKKKDGNFLLEVQLKNESRILNTMALRPNLSSEHRIVIDLENK